MPLISGIAANSRTGTSFITTFTSGNFDGAVAVDTSGNTFSTGSGGNVRKFNDKGELQWQTVWSPAEVGHECVNLNSSQAVVVAGTDTTNNRAYFAVLNNSTGAITLQRYFGTYNIIGARDTLSSHVDSSGNIYLLFMETNTSNVTVGHVLKITSAGALSWSRRISVSAGTGIYPYSVKVDASGNVFVAVSYDTNLGYFNVGLLKYSSAGTLLWQRGLTTGGSNLFPNGMTIDSSGNVYLTADGSGSLVAKIATGGTLTWLWEYDSAGGGITTDNSHIYIVYWGGVYLLKINLSDGSLVWQRNFFRVGGSAISYGVATSTSHLHFTGYGNSIQWAAKFPKTGGELGRFTLGANTWAWAVSTRAYTSNTGFFSFITPALTSATVTPTATSSSSTMSAGSATFALRRI